MDSELREVLREFVIESNEYLDQLERDLVVLEQEPGNAEVLAGVFRTFHTIKGTCGVFDFHRLEALTHAGENLLGALREHKLRVTPAIVGVLLALGDAVRRTMGHIERTESEGDADHAALIARLEALQSGDAVAEPADEPDLGEARLATSDSTIRIDVGVLDKLMNLVGELVLARNQVLQYAGGRHDPVFDSTTQRLNLITTELQEGVMKTRLQPIASVWNKLPRACRDLALACGKQVRLSMDGKQTELDRSIIEAIKDPLTHLVRNAIDHGIEPPEERRRAGKPADGNLVLRAYHEGGQVNLEISDDGRGIDPRRVAQRAIERGLISPDKAARMAERELFGLIFLPGFSTAQSVTSVSGRGVGMDVVKTNIEKISGTVDVQSRLGYGTTVRLKIPLTLAIIPALLVGSGGDCFAIPQASLLELVRLEGEQARERIESMHGVPVYRLRNELLPLVYLNEKLGIDSLPGEDTLIVVLQADERPFGLVVDAIHDTEEIVVKPLGKLLKGIPLYAGATILGDGRVALILDVMGLAQAAHLVAEARERMIQHATEPAPSRLRQLLLVGLGEHRLAIPLDRVARLEEVPAEAVERAAGREAIQYRGKILPLVRLAELLPGAAAGRQSGALQIVVAGDESVGLVVDRVLDITEADIEPCSGKGRLGLGGSAIIQQRVTDLIDVDGVLAVGQASA